MVQFTMVWEFSGINTNSWVLAQNRLGADGRKGLQTLWSRKKISKRAHDGRGPEPKED